MREIKLNEMKQIEVNILTYIDEICKKNNIDYFLISGSLIGAVKYDGMIPWDDDIDIALTRDNYFKLKKILLNDNNERFKTLDHENSKDYFYPYMKVIDSSTVLNDEVFKDINNYGIFVDIFCYSNIPENKRESALFYKKIMNTQRLIFCWSLRKNNAKTMPKKIVKQFFIIYSKFIGIDRILKKYNSLLSKYENTDTKYVINNWPGYGLELEIQEKEDLMFTCKHTFENKEFLIPKNYDKVLRRTYGNYLITPPIEERESQHMFKAYWKN